MDCSSLNVFTILDADFRKTLLFEAALASWKKAFPQASIKILDLLEVAKKYTYIPFVKKAIEVITSPYTYVSEKCYNKAFLTNSLRFLATKDLVPMDALYIEGDVVVPDGQVLLNHIDKAFQDGYRIYGYTCCYYVKEAAKSPILKACDRIEAYTSAGCPEDTILTKDFDNDNCFSLYFQDLGIYEHLYSMSFVQSVVYLQDTKPSSLQDLKLIFKDYDEAILRPYARYEILNLSATTFYLLEVEDSWKEHFLKEHPAKFCMVGLVILTANVQDFLRVLLSYKTYLWQITKVFGVTDMFGLDWKCERAIKKKKRLPYFFQMRSYSPLP